MSALLDERHAALYERLVPVARALLEDAAAHALALHAEELAPEHLLSTVLADETCAATRMVLFAFADPETLAAEVLALSPGFMVIGARRTLPFSVRGARALEDALALARARGEAEVLPRHLLEAARCRLDDAQRAALAGLGLAPAAGRAQGDPAPAAGEPFLRHFSREACRALGAASRAAQRRSRARIAPAHLVLGALEVDPDGAPGASGTALERALGGIDDDPTPPAPRRLTPDARLRALLGGLTPPADTLAVLGWFLDGGSAEVRELLQRQKVTRALYEQCRSAFSDA